MSTSNEPNLIALRAINNIEAVKVRNTFWSYTSLSSLDKILESGFFFASNLDNMNDKNESKRHIKDKDFVHALCFCHSASERIPMWYLYGGLTGEGCALGFSNIIMRDWIEQIKNVYPVINDENGNLKVDEYNTLLVGRDVIIDNGWVFYQKIDDPCYIKYKSTHYSLKPNERSKFEKDNFFIKDYPWEYEKEFRILLKNETAKKYNRLAIKIPREFYPELKLRLAPELSNTRLRRHKRTLNKICNLINPKVEESTLGIQMDLLKRNEYHIKEYAKEHSDTICKAIKEARECKSQEDEFLSCK